MLKRRTPPPHTAANASRFGPLLDEWLWHEPGSTLGIDAVARILCGRTKMLALTLDQARKVVGYMRPYCALAGDVLIEQDDTDGSLDLLLIVQGTVRLYTTVRSPDATYEVELGKLTTGDFLGDATLLDGHSRHASYVALTDVVGATLSRASLQVLAQDHPAIVTRFMAAVCQRLVIRVRHNNRYIGMQMEHVRQLQDRLSQVSAPPDADDMPPHDTRYRQLP